MKAVFDPTLARESHPSRDEIAKLAAKFKAQDEAHAKALAQRDELAAEKRRRDRTAPTADQKRRKLSTPPPTTATTRKRKPVTPISTSCWAKSRVAAHRGQGIANTKSPACLTPTTSVMSTMSQGANGLPLAVVEAKRTTINPHQGQQQAKAVRRLPGADDWQKANHLLHQRL